MQVNGKKVIYGRGKKVLLIFLTTPVAAAVFISFAVVCFLNGQMMYIALGIGILAMFIACLVGTFFIATRKVVFQKDFLLFPLEYVMLGVPFSKNIVPYKELLSVDLLSEEQSDDDCVDGRGNKLACIQFLSTNGEKYRMKLEYFSKKQAVQIIEETKVRMKEAQSSDK